MQSDITHCSHVYYEEEGEQYDRDAEEYIDCNWSYYKEGCGCCSERGPLTPANAASELDRLAELHRKMAEDYERLAAQAKKEIEDAESDT